MRRLWRIPRGRYTVARAGRLDRLRHLVRALSGDEYRALHHLTGGLGHLPFDDDGDVLDHVLLSAGDDDMELLIKCQRALRGAREPESDGGMGGGADGGTDGGADADPASGAGTGRRQPRMAFTFDADAADLRPFLASLRRNGFRAMSVDGVERVTVFVEVHGTSDLEIVQTMALATSLRELVARATGHTLRGRRAGR